MIKKILLMAALMLPVCVSAQKLAVVDTKAVFDSMPEKVAAEAELNELLAKYKVESDKLEKEFNNKFADFQALDPSTPKSIKAMRMQEIQDNQKKIESYQEMVNRDMEAKSSELLDPIKAKLQMAVDSVSVAGGYMLVLDVSKTPVAFKSAEVIDITPEVKNALGLAK